MECKLVKQAVAEFVGTFTLIFIGVGAIYNNTQPPGVDLLGIAMAHGLAIAVMVAATAGISGGHLNPAVTLGVWLSRKIDGKGAVVYWVAQMLGAVGAALVLRVLLRHEVQSGKAFSAVNIIKNGTPSLQWDVSMLEGLGIEAVLTFFLVFVVIGTAINPRGPQSIAPLAIGLTIAMGILFGGPFTGGAINPARWFGPAAVTGDLGNAAVYIIGPMLGGGVAGLVYGRFLLGGECSEGKPAAS
jgi:MIP family channel proteins